MKENYKSDKPCIVCNETGINKVCYHHLLTKKAHPELKSDERVLISVCQKHHSQFHNKGTSYMAETYPAIRNFLITHGWYYCQLSKKWRLEKI